MKRLFLLSLSLLIINTIDAQNKKGVTRTAEEQYEWRTQQSKLYGTYIPRDLTDAFLELNRLIDPSSKAKFKSASEEIVAQKLHFSLGQWMMVNWGFYEGSRLTVFMNKLGLYYPDDMARFLIISFHRSLNQNPLDVKKLVENLIEKRENLKEEELQKGQTLYEQTRIVEQQDSIKQQEN